MRDARLYLPLLLLLLLAGCGSNMAQVTGTVTYEGKALKEGTIIFETTGARPASGKIVEGKIVEVMTLKEGDGITPGTHKVAIHAFETTGGAGGANPGDKSGVASMMPKRLIPESYGNPETSKLTAEIKAGTNEVKYELKKNP